jgi:hypothetical protein
LKEVEEDQKPSYATRAAKIVLFLVGVPSLVVGILQLLPRVSISPQPALIATNAFSAPFVVSNDGYIPIYDVNASCSPKGVTYIDPAHPKGGLTIQQEGSDSDETGGFDNPKLLVPKLDPASRATFPCGLLNTPLPAEWICGAHILMIVKYHAPLLPFIIRHHRQRFELVRDSSGQFRWIEESLRG